MNEQENQFRIGGVYRQQSGQVVKLRPIDEYFYAEKWEREFPGHVFAHALSLRGDAVCFVSLVDGRFVRTMDRDSPQNLIPGELTQTASGWVALGAEKQEDELRKVDPSPVIFGMDWSKDALHPADARMIARDGPAKPALVLFTCVDCTGCSKCAPASTAKPNPFAAFRNPDACNGPSDHLNASRHQMAWMSD